MNIVLVLYYCSCSTLCVSSFYPPERLLSLSHRTWLRSVCVQLQSHHATSTHSQAGRIQPEELDEKKGPPGSTWHGFRRMLHMYRTRSFFFVLVVDVHTVFFTRTLFYEQCWDSNIWSVPMKTSNLECRIRNRCEILCLHFKMWTSCSQNWVYWTLLCRQ